MTVEEIFEKCQKITKGKRQDYTIGPDRNENFHRSAIIISWFAKDRDKPYAALIGTKMARLGSLLSREAKPNYESIEDNWFEYVQLWTRNTWLVYSVTVWKFRDKSIEISREKRTSWEWTPQESVDYMNIFGQKTTKLYYNR